MNGKGEVAGRRYREKAVESGIGNGTEETRAGAKSRRLRGIGNYSRAWEQGSG